MSIPLNSNNATGFDISFNPDVVYDLDEITKSHDRSDGTIGLSVKVVETGENNSYIDDVVSEAGEIAITNNIGEKQKITRNDIRKYLFN